MKMIRVIIESPYAGNIERNVKYARAAMRDSLNRGEAPFASHLIYMQPGILDDDNHDERQQGIDAGIAWGHVAALVAVYQDLGVSKGMRYGIEKHQEAGRPVVSRTIAGWSPNCDS